MNLLCGVSDGKGKRCGRRVAPLLQPLDPSPPIVPASCPKHGYVEAPRDAIRDDTTVHFFHTQDSDDYDRQVRRRVRAVDRMERGH
jgi:hypothetical protein